MSEIDIKSHSVRSLPLVSFKIIDDFPKDMFAIAVPGCLKLRATKSHPSGKRKFRIEFDKRKIAIMKNGNYIDMPKEAIYFLPEKRWSFDMDEWDKPL